MKSTLIGCLLLLAIPWPLAAQEPPGKEKLFARENLVAWCIVPFDAKKRGPEERAAMLKRLGFSKFAYDYRAEHIPTFDAEMEALKKHGIELTAWWFPGNAERRSPRHSGRAQAAQAQDAALGHRRRRADEDRPRSKRPASRPRRPASGRSPRRPPRSAARSPSTTTAAGSASRKISWRSSRS